jgi:twitching motility protein PilT
VVAVEVLIPTPAIRNLIRDDKVHQIYALMQAGQEKIGTQTLNQSLATLYYAGAITIETARLTSSLRDELMDMINRGVGVVPGAGMARAAAPAHGRQPADQGARR